MFKHCNYQNLIDECSVAVHLPIPMWFLEVFDLVWCDNKHKNNLFTGYIIKLKMKRARH